jgi:hypothetical protein
MTRLFSDPLDDLFHRARAEFREMPGLRLTFSQMQRLWTLDDPTCQALVERLLRSRVLTRTPSGQYVRFGVHVRLRPKRQPARFLERTGCRSTVHATASTDS